MLCFLVVLGYKSRSQFAMDTMLSVHYTTDGNHQIFTGYTFYFWLLIEDNAILTTTLTLEIGRINIDHLVTFLYFLYLTGYVQLYMSWTWCSLVPYCL